jgi:hypothetical protein
MENIFGRLLSLHRKFRNYEVWLAKKKTFYFLKKKQKTLGSAKMIRFKPNKTKHFG